MVSKDPMADLLLATVSVVLAYAVGGVPTAYLAARRLRGVDIRTLGSRNVGTANAVRQLGWSVGLFVLGVDIAKGAAAMLVGMGLGLGEWAIFTTAMAVAVGHNWSPYLHLSGGKGVASILGISLVMVPWLSLLASPFVVAGLLATRSIVWATALGTLVLNVIVVVSGQPASTVATCAVLTNVMFGTHFWRSLPEVAATLRHRDLRGFGQIE